MKREDGRAKEFHDAAIDVFLEEGVSRYHIKMRSVSTSVEAIVYMLIYARMREYQYYFGLRIGSINYLSISLSISTDPSQ